ncbi:hypothetical protein VT52_019430 [Streptomyces malaysiense]|uniref:Uncharacterized protein n=2 Tax=Streptomyces malaysiense TaxID=1428626 RepID=A0A1J4PY84_9ACTN|nr:hypothetical protein VT52_019430 [Streptomyces malaysiense]
MPSQDLDALFGDGHTDASEIRPSWTPNGAKGQGSLDGRCRIMSGTGPYGRQVDIHVHRLAGDVRTDNVPWSDEFLSAALTPLGGGVLGMASDTRAWAALPSTCVDPVTSGGYAVVDVRMGYDGFWKNDSLTRRNARQKALSRTVVHVVNGTMAALGCSGTLREPGSPEAMPVPRPVHAGGPVCGVPGVRLPDETGSDPQARVSVGDERPARTCDILTGVGDHPQYRLQTVQDPNLAQAVGAGVHTGPGITRKGGREAIGTYSPAIADVSTKCRGRTVLFLAQQTYGLYGYTFIRRAFPAYVTAEAKRLDCGPLEIRIPD